MKRVNFKNKSLNHEELELNYEVRLTKGQTDFIHQLNQVDGIYNTIFVSYNKEYLG